VLILDASLSDNYKCVKAVLLSPLTSYNDGFDIILKNDKLIRERIALRITAGPVQISELLVYLEELQEKSTFEAILASLKIKTYNYNDLQIKIIKQILDNLQIIREKAIEDYENSIDQYEIFIPFNMKNFDYKPITMAAASDEVQIELIEFWDKETQVKENSIKLVENDLYRVRISNLDGGLYLIVIALSGKIQFGDVSIKSDEQLRFNYAETVTIEKRFFLPLKFKAQPDENLILEFKINDENFQYELKKINHYEGNKRVRKILELLDNYS